MASSSSPVQVLYESGKSDSDKKRCRSRENSDDEIIVSPEQEENQERPVKRRSDSPLELSVEESLLGPTEREAEPNSIKEKLQQERKTLRIYGYRDVLLEAVESRQVVIVVGDTGCGKTTQIPQYLYEAGYGKKGRIGCTQPHGFTARSAAARVSQEMGVKLGHDVVGYSIPFEDCTSEKTVLRYMTDGTLLHQLYGEPELISYSVLMVDEAHERTLSTDILVGLLKDILPSRTNLKLLISTATLDCAEKFSELFDSALVLDIRILSHYPPHHQDDHVLYLEATEANNYLEANYLDIAIRTALEIHENEPSGDILVFLTDREEIEVAAQQLHQPHQLSICPFYENMPAELEAQFFETTPKGVRKVVLATSIAETFWPTKVGVNYVVDSGFCKNKSYDSSSEMESLKLTRISEASAMLRGSQALLGKCFRLYKHNDHGNPKPEVQRSNLANVVLTLRHLGVNDSTRFHFLDPPPTEALRKASQLLFVLGALNNVGELTEVGERMAEFPVDAMLSKAIVASDQYKCSNEVISIVAMLSAGDHDSVFHRPEDEQADADNARMHFHSGNVGDHIALLKVYNEWKDANYSAQWCHENYIQVRTMKRARDIRDQLERLLEKVGIELSSNPFDIEPIKKAITSGFFAHSAKLQQNSYIPVKLPPKNNLHIHYRSGLAQMLPRPGCVLYHELDLETNQYMRQVTEINSEWLQEVAPHY
ncbi:pre-mRNA-splicing factor ATP-dependent RNA helicase DEAH1-like [Rosa rugosa]|uniref:pre-mRNA-splicing factor ATP-dependent RNA helicase DEAH1-like n=1 Tax=Rosa rugosa TaxID=74645 RepID=UPI002B40D45E|nr:pre-mRNA-splicing factor ATP-dependent RNA helicase DEAH1-like [Rosa rugosa]